MPTTIRFTKATLDSLPLPEAGKRTEYSDDRVPDLRLRVTSTGAKSFCVFKRVRGGSPIRETLGSYPAMTIDQARTKAAEVVANIAGGANPSEVRRAARGELTFGQLFNEYLERHARPNKRTWEDDLQRYEQYLKTPLQAKKLSQIDQQTIRRLLDSITSNGHPAVSNRVKALASTVFNRGIEWGHTTSNPVIGIRSNREISRDRFLSGEELERLFTALTETLDDNLRDYVWLSILTAARRSNVMAMRWADIDQSRKTWTIPASESKNGQPLYIPLHDSAMQILNERLARRADNSIYVFPGTGQTGHLVEPKKGWYALLERAGIEDFRFHDLRRTNASWQAISGVSTAIIGKSLGHQSQQSTQVYARLSMDPVRAGMNQGIDAMLAKFNVPVRDENSA